MEIWGCGMQPSSWKENPKVEREGDGEESSGDTDGIGQSGDHVQEDGAIEGGEETGDQRFVTKK